jgi:hypothetical protein
MMVSFLLAEEKESEYYLPELHGKVFTLSEIRSIVESFGLPGEQWGTCPRPCPISLRLKSGTMNPFSNTSGSDLPEQRGRPKAVSHPRLGL